MIKDWQDPSVPSLALILSLKKVGYQLIKASAWTIICIIHCRRTKTINTTKVNVATGASAAKCYHLKNKGLNSVSQFVLVQGLGQGVIFRPFLQALKCWL